MHGFCIVCKACTLHIHTCARIQSLCMQGCKKACLLESFSCFVHQFMAIIISLLPLTVSSYSNKISCERHREFAFSMLVICYLKPMKGHHPFIIYENVEQEKGNFSHLQLHSTSHNWLPKLQWVKLWWDWCLQNYGYIWFGGGTVLLVSTTWVKWQDLLRGGKLDMTRPPLFSVPLL